QLPTQPAAPADLLAECRHHRHQQAHRRAGQHQRDHRTGGQLDALRGHGAGELGGPGATGEIAGHAPQHHQHRGGEVQPEHKEHPERRPQQDPPPAAPEAQAHRIAPGGAVHQLRDHHRGDRRREHAHADHQRVERMGDAPVEHPERRGAQGEHAVGDRGEHEHAAPGHAAPAGADGARRRGGAGVVGIVHRRRCRRRRRVRLCGGGGGWLPGGGHVPTVGPPVPPVNARRKGLDQGRGVLALGRAARTTEGGARHRQGVSAGHRSGNFSHAVPCSELFSVAARGPGPAAGPTKESPMITRRHVLSAGAAGSAALALAACGGDSGGSGGEVDGEGKTITMWLMEGTNASADAYVEELKTAFTEATGATLDVQVQPWDGAHDKFVTAMAGGTGPDVAEVGTTWVPEFADAGGLDPLTEDIEAAGLGDGLVEGLAEAGTLEGEMYGMPWYAGVRSILGNREMLEAAGVAEQPQSWDDLLAMITALKEHDPEWIPFPVAGGSLFAAMPFVWGAGGEIA